MTKKPRSVKVKDLALQGAISELVERLKESEVSKVVIDIERGEATLTYQTTKTIRVKG